MIVVVVFVPRTDAPAVRAALADAGAGAIGAYTGCSFSTVGEGRFRPETGAAPAIGSVGTAEVVDEVRIECVCPRSKVRQALEAMLAAHPYEEVAYHCYEALTIDDF